jgi:hypothetical protein
MEMSDSHNGNDASVPRERKGDEHASSSQRGPVDRNAKACSSSRANVGPLTKISFSTTFFLEKIRRRDATHKQKRERERKYEGK